jgi:hypothetical protein
MKREKRNWLRVLRNTARVFQEARESLTLSCFKSSRALHVLLSGRNGFDRT